MSVALERRAFYDVATGTGGWRDWVTLLHPPYTLWHLSYVAMGAALAAPVVWWRLGGTELAFFLAVGIGAHALDELRGRPLRTGISSAALVVAAVVGVGAAITAGLMYGGLKLLPFVIVGAFLVCAYSLEWFDGRLHGPLGFAVAWGVFPTVVGAYAQHWSLSPAVAVGATAAFLLSLVQRTLSVSARFLRREARLHDLEVSMDGRKVDDGWVALISPMERALSLLTWTVPLVAAAVLLMGS
jgi:hypothetical protein